MWKDLLFAGGHAALSFAELPSNRALRAVQKQLGGFCTGVCHPCDDRLDDLHALGIGWVRFDVVRPMDEKGRITEGYLACKARMQRYRDAGFRIMLVTPCPREYATTPFSPTDPVYKKQIVRDIRYLAKDLQGLVSAFQVANEMQVEYFRSPLTEAQSRVYLALQLRALQPVKGSILIGFNLNGFTMVSYVRRMQPYFRYCDYIGLDLYLGCFESQFKSLAMYDLVLRFLWSFCKKPIWLAEFGYIGIGQPKSPEEKTQILQSYGVQTQEQAAADIHGFISRLPERFRRHLLQYVEYGSDVELAEKLFHTELCNHLYRELPEGVQLRKYRHTPEDQARFLTDVFRRLQRLPFVCGAFVYCYTDSDICYICGQQGCPVETGWGLVDTNGRRKPAWYALRDAATKRKASR